MTALLGSLACERERNGTKADRGIDYLLYELSIRYRYCKRPAANP
jgi:hypothetical protein